MNTMSELGKSVFNLGSTMNAVSVEAHKQGMAKGLREGEAKRQKLVDALEECLEYFEGRYDVVDGDYGQPKANAEMQMGQMIEHALGRRP